MRLYHGQKVFKIPEAKRNFTLYLDNIFHIAFLLYIQIVFDTRYHYRHCPDALIFSVYRFAFVSKGWAIYMWAFLLIGISTASITLFSYIYFAFFIAYFIGNIRDRVPFHILYYVHLTSAAVAANFSFVLKRELFLTQIPFVVITLISAILLPFSIRIRKDREQLEEKLEFANERISELVKMEERQRIARDLHDTLGQKLSLIGLKAIWREN